MPACPMTEAKRGSASPSSRSAIGSSSSTSSHGARASYSSAAETRALKRREPESRIGWAPSREFNAVSETISGGRSYTGFGGGAAGSLALASRLVRRCRRPFVEDREGAVVAEGPMAPLSGQLAHDPLRFESPHGSGNGRHRQARAPPQTVDRLNRMLRQRVERSQRGPGRSPGSRDDLVIFHEDLIEPL